MDYTKDYIIGWTIDSLKTASSNIVSGSPRLLSMKSLPHLFFSFEINHKRKIKNPSEMGLTN